MPLAFANIYTELASAISAQKENQSKDLGLVPTAEDGADSIRAIYAVAASGEANGVWTKL